MFVVLQINISFFLLLFHCILKIPNLEIITLKQVIKMS